MICYRDMTFCSSDCLRTKQECHRVYDEETAAAAKEWWSGCKGEPPVAFSDFSGHCPSYLPPKGKNDDE